jgi:ribonuclease HI
MEQPNETICSRIIITDSLSSLTALKKKFLAKELKGEQSFEHAPEKGENLKLIWVPAHSRIERNEALDDAAKDALSEDILPGTKAAEMDWNDEELMRNTMN